MAQTVVRKIAYVEPVAREANYQNLASRRTAQQWLERGLARTVDVIEAHKTKKLALRVNLEFDRIEQVAIAQLVLDEWEIATRIRRWLWERYPQQVGLFSFDGRQNKITLTFR